MASTMPDGAILSDDGNYWWDGEAWQPVPGGAADTGGGAPSAESWGQDGGAAGGMPFRAATPTITDTGDGVEVRVDVTALHATEAGDFQLVIKGTAAGGQAETIADLVLPLRAFSAGEERNIGGPLHLEGGEWIIHVTIADIDGNAILEPEAQSHHVDGPQHHAAAFDGTIAYPLAMQITSIDNVGTNEYRVSYQVTNGGDRPVPAGLTVVGSILGEVTSSEVYHYTEELPAGHAVDRHLTLEGTDGEPATVTIGLDVGGPSETTDAVHATLRADGAIELMR